MKKSILLFLVMLLWMFPAFAEEPMVLVANTNLKTTLQVGNTQRAADSRMSLHLATSPESLAQGIVGVNDLNLLLMNIDQFLLSNRVPRGKRTGPVGFALQALPRNQIHSLKYNPQEMTLEGTLQGRVDFPQLEEIFPSRPSNEDFFTTRTQRASLQFRIKLDKPLPTSAGDQVLRLDGEMQASLRVAGIADAKINSYQIHVAPTRFALELAIFRLFEVARRLCLQPVKIRANALDLSATGAGFAFGFPGAVTQWGKSDVVFSTRPWMFINNGSLKVASAGAEETAIRAAVQTDDCVEVFFVENFSPVSLHGGGATWASGTASAQVITSDGNAVGGIDLTHLAHELGHVLALHHPGVGAPNASWPDLTDGNSGTLMCPSGWMNDNPKKNSQGNKTHTANPLLTFSLKVKGPGPDCLGNADCGACP